MNTLFSVSSTPPELTKMSVSVPCPVSGKPVAIDSLDDSLLASGILGHGYAIATSSSLILAPLSGQIIRADPLDYAVVLRADNGLSLRIKLGIGTHRLMGEKCLFMCRIGEKVKKGQVLFVVSPPYLKQQGVESVCILTVLNSEKLSAVVPNRLGHCRAMEDELFTVYV